MAALTSIDEARLRGLIGHYGVGELHRFWPASEGIENSNYFVEVQRDGLIRSYVLTILEKAPHGGDLLVPLLDRLARAGLPVAPVRRNLEGQAYVEVAGKPAILSPRLPGRHLINPSLHHCESVGRLLGRLHLAARPLLPQAPAHPRDSSWLGWQGRVARGRLGFGDTAILDFAVRASRSLLSRRDVRRLPRGIIHGDLFRDNVLFTGQALSGVVDFHHAAAGYWLFDIAVAINDWCTEASGRLDPDRTWQLLRAYNSVRALSAQELWFLPAFGCYAAACFWLSRLNGPTEGRRKDPEEFQRITQQHLAHAFYGDQRLLQA